MSDDENYYKEVRKSGMQYLVVEVGNHGQFKPNPVKYGSVIYRDKKKAIERRNDNNAYYKRWNRVWVVMARKVPEFEVID